MQASSPISALNDSDELIKQVISIAKATFISGFETEKKTPSLNFFHCLLPGSKPHLFQRDTTHITGTNFIAAAGPHSRIDFGNFIADILDSKIPICHVIALGNCLSRSDYGYKDFYDYIITEREEIIDDIKISIKKISGTVSRTESGHQVFPDDVVCSELTITPAKANSSFTGEKKLPITLLNLRDNHALELTSGNHPLLETLWQLYSRSLHEPTLIHCTAGKGRTGHLILTFEILKKYAAIFEEKKPKTIAADIHKILKNMRKDRPALIYKQAQFSWAIRNAVMLHRYALEKTYLLDEKPQSAPSPGLRS